MIARHLITCLLDLPGIGHQPSVENGLGSRFVSSPGYQAMAVVACVRLVNGTAAVWPGLDCWAWLLIVNRRMVDWESI